MSKVIKDIALLFVVLFGLFFAFLLAMNKAVSAADWSQCSNGESIVRCQTYNCPEGDTNSDGLCNLEDTRAKVTDYRNDALCANPPSGCGTVEYFAEGQASSCSTRVKENNNHCDLYNTSNPEFGQGQTKGGFVVEPSPTPTVAPKASKTKGGEKLPETGPEQILILAAVVLGFIGSASIYAKSV